MLFAFAALVAAEPAVPVCGYDVVRTYPHDATSFTEGLLFHNGQLYEGTGIEGRSKMSKRQLQNALG